jgi:hypothetical protein
LTFLFDDKAVVLLLVGGLISLDERSAATIWLLALKNEVAPLSIKVDVEVELKVEADVEEEVHIEVAVEVGVEMRIELELIAIVGGSPTA